MSIPLVPQLLRSHLVELAENDQRLDGRRQWDGREVQLEIGILGNAEGSAKVRMGDTIVYAGVKFQTMTPYSDRPNQGGLMCSAELRPVAGRKHEPGPPSPESIELGRVVDRGIRESGCIDTEALCIIPGEKAWQVILDLYAISDDGNLFDACSYASTAAINSCKIPKYEMQDEKPVKIEGEFIEPPITTLPVSVTMAKIGGFILVDPTIEEWGIMDARITITSNSDGNVVALQKGGSDGFSQEELIECAELSIKVGSKIREIIKQSKQSDN